MTHPNDYRYDVYEGPHRIGRQYRQKEGAIKFCARNGDTFTAATTLNGKVITRWTGDGRKIQPEYYLN